MPFRPKIEAVPRLASAAFLSSALLLGACASSESTSDSVATTVGGSTTEAPAETTATTDAAPESTTSGPEASTTEHAFPEVKAAEPSEIHKMPPGFFMESSAFGERLVLFGADAKGGGGVFWAADQEFATAMNIFDIVDPNIDPGSINEMVYFEGRYYGFPIWGEAEDDLSPTMYVSDDGSTWEKTEFGSITKQASLRLTPDAPSDFGGAGVANAIVANGQIEATGWVTENGQGVPVMWVGDGSSWVQIYLPKAGSASQGGHLASSELGRMVTLEGGSHYGFGTFLQVPGSEWMPVVASKDVEGADAFTRFLGASDSAFYRFEFTHTGESVLTSSPDGVTWNGIDLPPVETDSFGFHVSANDQLVTYDQAFLADEDAKALVWSLTKDGWSPTTYEGTRIVMVDDNHIVTADDAQLYVYDRDGQ